MYFRRHSSFPNPIESKHWRENAHIGTLFRGLEYLTLF